MLYIEEIRKAGASISSLFTRLHPAPVRVPSAARSAAPPLSQRSYQISLSVAQVLVGFTSAFSAVGLLFWAVLKLWLFEK